MIYDMKSFYPRLSHISPFTEVSHSLGNKFLYYFQLKIKWFREIDGNQNVYPGKKQIHKTFPTISRATQTQLKSLHGWPKGLQTLLKSLSSVTYRKRGSQLQTQLQRGHSILWSANSLLKSLRGKSGSPKVVLYEQKGFTRTGTASGTSLEISLRSFHKWQH